MMGTAIAIFGALALCAVVAAYQIVVGINRRIEKLEAAARFFEFKIGAFDKWRGRPDPPMDLR